MLVDTNEVREDLSPSPTNSVSPPSSLSSSASSPDTISPIISPSDSPTSSTVLPQIPPQQLFRLSLPHDNQALFLQTSPLTPTGILLYLHPTTMIPSEQDITHPDALVSVYETLLVGTVNVGDVDRMRDVCRGLTPEELGIVGVGVQRCREWVRETARVLMAEDIMKPVPPRMIGNHVPRHHHTAHCQHQRHHIHHPYRRRRAHALLENQILTAAQTVQKRD